MDAKVIQRTGEVTQKHKIGLIILTVLMRASNSNAVKGYNNLFKKTTALRYDVNPELGKLSKTTFNNALKALIDAEAITFMEDHTNKLTIKPRIYTINPMIRKLLDQIIVEQDNQVLRDVDGITKELKILNPKNAAVLASSFIIWRNLLTLKIAAEAPEMLEFRLAYLVKELHAVFQAFTEASRVDPKLYAGIVEQINNDWYDFRDEAYKEVIQEIKTRLQKE